MLSIAFHCSNSGSLHGGALVLCGQRCTPCVLGDRNICPHVYVPMYDTNPLHGPRQDQVEPSPSLCGGGHWVQRRQASGGGGSLRLLQRQVSARVPADLLLGCVCCWVAAGC